MGPCQQRHVWLVAAVIVCGCVGGLSEGEDPVDGGSSDSSTQGDASGHTDADADLDADIDSDADADEATGAGPCGACRGPEDCGGEADWCLRNSLTEETFCTRDCSRDFMSCPPGYACLPIEAGALVGFQCVPDYATCGEPPDIDGCDPPCGSDELCVSNVCVDNSEEADDLQYCVDVINNYRADHGRSALSRSSALEACAAEGAEEDSRTGTAHSHFSRTGGCGGVADAENELPGWPRSMYGGIPSIIDQGTAMMMAEGPGGGHYENILGSHTSAGCGIFITSRGNVWLIQNFR